MLHGSDFSFLKCKVTRAQFLKSVGTYMVVAV